MLERDRRFPDLVMSRLPEFRKMSTVLFTAIFVVVVAAILIPVHGASTRRIAVTIPPPPPIAESPEAIASASLPAASRSVAATPTATPSPTETFPHIVSPPPVAGASYAGSVVMNETGAQLTSWNQTSSFCSQKDWEVANGMVSTDSSGDAVLATTGGVGSCVGLVSPDAYSSAVIEAYVYFPPLPGESGTIANWTSIWLTNQAAWPEDGELDAVEAEPVTGKNATAWHWGTPGDPLSMSTDGFASGGTLPVDGPNLTPGWHVVDIAYAKGFFAVYYDGREFTSLNSDVITGAPLNILITTSVTPDNSEVQQTIGGQPLNSDSSPAGMAVKFVKVWSFR
jgi:hypothetical protein